MKFYPESSILSILNPKYSLRITLFISSRMWIEMGLPSLSGRDGGISCNKLMPLIFLLDEYYEKYSNKYGEQFSRLEESV
mgnify:FL=1|jgi:hypothetical protein